MEERFFTARATDEGQPDRAADIIADIVLDEYLKVDLEVKADIKVTLTKGCIYIFGEITSAEDPDIEKAIRLGLKEIGYEDNKSGIDPYKCDVIKNIQKQSQDIARILHPQDGGEIPASDTGMIYGYATNEDTNFLPKSYNIANQISQRLSFVRKSGVIDGLLPDSQVSVTMEYLHDIPQRVASIVITSHHKADVDLDWLRMEISEKVINNVCKKNIDSNTKLIINPGGRFIIGGPGADIGVSGRKVENETYGGFARYGGLHFSGTDPFKNNRSIAFVARQAAINIVSKRMADKVELYIGYAFGVVEPICVDVETFGTAMYDDQEIIDYVNMNYSFGISSAIHAYNLQRPIYKDLALNGYWGDGSKPWERVLI